MKANTSSPKTQGLTLNFLEVVFNKELLYLPKAVYSDELYDEYKHNPDFFIYKFNDDLYVWKLNPTDQSLSGIFEEALISFNEHSPIFTKILERAIVRYFSNESYEIFKRRHSSIWEVELNQEKEGEFGVLVLRPTLAFSLRNLYSKREKKQVIALTVRRRGKPIFVGSEAEIKGHLADTRGFTRNNNGEIVASSHNRYIYLEATGQQQAYKNYLNRIESARNEFDYFKACEKRFNQVSAEFYLPKGLEISKFLLVNLPSASFETIKIPKPRYFYYNERAKTGYYDKMVSELKPYSFDLFNNQRLAILVVSPDEYEGSVGEYVMMLKAKLRTIFHLHDVEFRVETVKPPETYLDVINRIDAYDYQLAIILLSQKDKDIPTQKSPYYLTKAKLLNQRLPSQDLTIEKLRKNDNIINNDVALNVYSKIGGTAWTIEKSEKNVSELIIGVGSTSDDSGAWILGFANVFDYNGTYLVGDCSQLSTFDEYAENLETYLIDVLTRAFNKKGLSQGDRVRLLFHLFKESSEKYELKAVNNVLQQFKEYDIQYGLAHLSYNHNFRVFKNEGRSVPERGTFIQLSHNQALLHLGGRSVVPIQVRLDRRSEYRDLYEITKQVLHFTHLSFRSFIPASKPVTIKYPNLMAQMVHELKKVPDWDYSILDKLNDKLWFI